jgi:osmotically-inducible protein OsmY
MRQKDFTGVMNRQPIIFAALIGLLILGLAAVRAFGATPELTDMAISDAVEDELFMDKAVPSYRIDVTTVNGIVTLSGSVDNILAKERAARIAQIVKGARSVVNEVEVVPPDLRSDSAIRKDVEEALLKDPATDSYEIDVEVDDNIVTLSGTVQSWQEKELCETVAKGVKGVKALDSGITVVWPEERSDLEIRAEVEKALEWDAFVDHALIDVAVKDGKVTLTGTVGSAAEKDEAFWDAHVNGVESVDYSGLKVARWARDDDLKGNKYAKRSNEEIEAAVTDALLYDPRVSSFKVTPEADDGKVTLRGTVNNLKAKRAAAQDARNTVGVRLIDNRIKVRPAEPMSDKKIEDRIREALLRDPFVERYEIAVDVINGVAKLYGVVDTSFEKSQAYDVASKVKGVITVDNNLVVRSDAPVIQDLYDPYVDDRYEYDYDWYDYSATYPSKTDWRIKEDIKDEMFWSPFVDADDVKVMVDGGVATLTGTVDSWSEYNAAVDNAYEGGAVYVDNDLTLKEF